MTAKHISKYYAELKKILSAAGGDTQLFKIVVNAPFHNKLYATTLDLGIIVLLLVNPETKTIDRVALSDTESAEWAIKMTPVPFREIKIPVSNPANIIAKAIKTQQPQKTADWKFLFIPALSEEAARFNQAGAGIACSYVYPLLNTRSGGAMIFSYYQPPENIGHQHQDFMSNYSTLVAQVLS